MCGPRKSTQGLVGAQRQFASGGSEHDVASGAPEQAYAKRLFEALDLLADGAVRDVQFGRRRRDTAESGGGFKDAQRR